MLIKKFEEQAAKNPLNTAVRFAKESWTYDRLNRWANRIAHLIIREWPENNKNETVQPVGLLLDHGPAMIAAILGTLKAGKVYVPISVDYPEKRIAYMLSNSQASLILSSSAQKQRAEQLAVENKIGLVNIEAAEEPGLPEENPHREELEDRVAYIMYTSGSTGWPKGVVQTHRNATYYVRNWTRVFSITAADRMTLFSSFCHDGSVQDMFAALHSGAALYPFDMRSREESVKLSDFLVEEKITIWHSVPSLFTFFAGALDGRYEFKDLRFILLGGEAVREHEVNLFKKFFPFSTLANVYGQTESSVNSICLIGREDSYEKSLIGEPLDETQIFVVDEEGCEVDELEIGEIFVGSRYITPGYWQNQEESEKRFTPDEELGTLYGTGDQGRLLLGGGIEFMGRKDQQVKIRGFRVEVGEIETRLFQHEKIKEAVVLAKVDEQGGTYLCAYIVPHRSGKDQENEFTVSEMREYLSKELPDYMVPSYLVLLEKMPLTQSNKIDRGTLPEPEHIRPQLGVSYVAPASSLEKEITSVWKEVLKLDKVGINDNFFDLGGTSFDILKAAGGLYEILGRDVPVVTIFRYPTVSSLAAYLSQPDQGGEPVKTARKRKPLPPSSQVAVIGMAGRFPGAKNTTQFWENLKNGVESISFFSPGELEDQGVEAQLLRDPAYVGAFGVLKDTEYFDAFFFNYSPTEAQMMDPQLRIMHECCWEALEDAGYNAETYDGLIGLYAGNAPNQYWIALTYLNRREDIDTAFLNSNYSTKVSYKLNLTGPSFIVQTACSTSLVAIHLACLSLNMGECDMALAGGVSISLPDKVGYLYREGMILSPDGHCRAFDAEAGGTVFGNGAGMVVLKRLEDALTDGDTISAVIKGSAINNDGSRKVGVTAPSVAGQAEVVRAALELADIDPGSIGYIETHGTGTILGDPVEVEALKLAFDTGRRGYCAIGSVKTNVGHLNAASGVVGFIKTVLALKHKLLPANLHFHTPNPKIDFENSPFFVAAEPMEWKNDLLSAASAVSPLRAGINSFGIGGTNAHVILEEWGETNDNPPGEEAQAAERQYKLLLLSAKTPSALESMSENLLHYLKENPGVGLADAAYTLQVGRKPFRYRKMLLCADKEEIDGLPAAPVFQPEEGEKPVIFMIAGQGTQYVNMGLDLYKREPDFRQEMDCCFEILKELGLDLKAILYPELQEQPEQPSADPTHKFDKPGKPDKSNKSDSSHMSDSTLKSQTGEKEEKGDRPVKKEEKTNSSVPSVAINNTEIVQPLVFIFEYALAKLLIKWGIKPTAMIGYSLGEYIAACLSGVFSLRDALKLVVSRGKAAQRIAPGLMLNVPLPEEKIKPLLNKDTYLSIVNDPTCVVSGTVEAMEAFEKKMKEQRLLCARVNMGHGFHSPLMEPMRRELEKTAAGISLDTPRIPYISNVSGNWITVEEALDPQYWSKHLCAPARFSDGMQKLLTQDKAIFIEIGPGRVLGNMVRQHTDNKLSQVVLNTARHQEEQAEDDRYLLKRLGQLWLNGADVDWAGFYGAEKRRRISLPTYPFERQRYWLAGNPLKSGLAQPQAAPGEDAAAAVQPGTQERTGAAANIPRVSRPELSSAYAAPVSMTEKVLARIWQELLGIEQVGTEDDFFELGGDSVKAVAFAGRIQQELDTEVPLAEFFKSNTIKKIGQYIKESSGGSALPEIHPAEKKEFYRLSSTQKRLYILQEMLPESTGYNLPLALLLEGGVDKEKLKGTLIKLIERHESFRTSFGMLAGEPIQRVHSPEEIEFAIEYVVLAAEGGGAPSLSEKKGEGPREISGDSHTLDMSHLSHLVQKFIRPFDLSRAPLLRIGLVELEEKKQILIFDKHHIIYDGSSTAMFLHDFMTIYAGRGRELPPLKLQYKDYSQWQTSPPVVEARNKQEKYWIDQFQGEIPILNLPLDFARPVVQSFAGKRLRFTLSEQETGALKKVANKEGVTLYMLLLTIFNVLFMKLSGQEDIVFGTPTAGRTHPDLQQIIGMFVNTLALRNYPRGDMSFRKFLQELKERTLQAFANQEYQFEDLVEKIEVRRDTGRNPIFDVMFIMHNFLTEVGDIEELEIRELKLKNIEYDLQASILDLTFTAKEANDTLLFTVDYCTKLFKEETIKRFIGYYREIACSIPHALENDASLAEMEIMSRAEKKQVLVDFNDTEVDYPRHRTIHELFEQQAASAPDHTAVTGPFFNGSRVSLTYKQLNQSAQNLGGILISKGVKPGIIVGLMVERTVAMMVGIMGILKTGGAYLPIDPEYPRARIKYVLDRSGASLLLTQQDLIDSFENLDFGKEILDINGEYLYADGKKEAVVPNTAAGAAADLAYVIYTSGSTGNPKGVAIEHRNVVNFVKGMTERIDFVPGKTILALTTISFDIFVLETLLPLISGIKIVLAGEIEQRDPGAMARVIERNRVDMLQVTPSRLNLLLRSDENLACLHGIGEILVGGEAFPQRLFEILKEKFQGRICNMYGPTETTVWSAVKDLTGAEKITIGTPIANTQIYIVDKNNRPQPVGVAGELLIGGDGVGRGYLNNPELTAEKFQFDIYKSHKSYRTYRTGQGTAQPPSEGHTAHSSPKTNPRSPLTLYRTGDLARWLPKGEIDFLGRIDYQVKIRGFRIELEEIEIQLRRFPGIASAVVVDVERQDGEKYLAAYVVPQTGVLPDSLKTREMREFLSAVLPGYMIPSYFVPLEKIPLTPNGKVNRKALPEVEAGQQLETGATYVEPRTALEKEIVDIWREVLGRTDKIGIEDNFFDLGGTSLNLVQLGTRLNESLKLDIPVITMFRYPTVQSFLEHLEQKDSPGNGAALDKELDESLDVMDQTMGVMESLINDE